MIRYRQLILSKCYQKELEYKFCKHRLVKKKKQIWQIWSIFTKGAGFVLQKISFRYPGLKDIGGWFIYIGTHTGVASILMVLAANFCLHKLLLSAGTVLFLQGPCYYLHSTVARSKITDCPSATSPFCPRPSHVLFHPRLPNQLWLFPWHPAANKLELWCMTWFFQSSDLGLVCTKCMWDILLTHHHQNAYTYTSTLRILRPQHILTYVTHCTLATCNRLYLLFCPSTCLSHLAPFSLRYTNCFETDCFF